MCLYIYIGQFMDYHRKYLKYKAKYLNLLGGMGKKFCVKKTMEVMEVEDIQINVCG